MSSHRRARPRLFALLMALCAIPIISFVAALPWLKQQRDELVFLVAGFSAALVIVASFALDILHDRHLDEWHRNATLFSVRWGWAAASSLVALLLALPPIHDVIVHWAAIWGGAPNPDRRLVLVTFTFGFGTVVATQGVCMALLSIGWAFRKLRPAREPS